MPTKVDLKAAIDAADAALNGARRRLMEIEAEAEKVEAQIAEIEKRNEALIRECAQGSGEDSRKAAEELTALRPKSLDLRLQLDQLNQMIPHATDNVTARELAADHAKRNMNREMARRLQDDVVGQG